MGLTFKGEKLVSLPCYFVSFDLPGWDSSTPWEEVVGGFKDAVGYQKANPTFRYVTTHPDTDAYQKGWVIPGSKGEAAKKWGESCGFFQNVIWEAAPDNNGASNKGLGGKGSGGKKSNGKGSNPFASDFTKFAQGFGWDEPKSGKKTTGNQQSKKEQKSSDKSFDDGFDSFNDFVALEVTPEMEFCSAVIGNGDLPKETKLRIVKDIYRVAAKHLHPDKAAGVPDATAKMAALNAAYKQLMKGLKP